MAKLVNHGYIGTWKFEKPREPGTNTIAYYPFKDNILDQLGNTSLTQNGTKDGIGYRFNVDTTISNAASTKFMSYWFKINANTGEGAQTGFIQSVGELSYGLSQSSAHSYQIGAISFFYSSSYSYRHYSYVGIDTGIRHNIAYGYNGTNVIGYYDGVKYTVGTGPYNFGNTVKLLRIWGTGAVADVTFSEIILESQPRTDNDYYIYYNQLKSKYGK